MNDLKSKYPTERDKAVSFAGEKKPNVLTGDFRIDVPKINKLILLCMPSVYCLLWFHGVMVSTLDFESSDPSSNLGEFRINAPKINKLILLLIPATRIVWFHGVMVSTLTLNPAIRVQISVEPAGFLCRITSTLSHKLKTNNVSI
ncbi:hypothetical protein CEXT_644851 [Caerostris extrusa]|uniref:Uncharacterized protein n=1 Tax=Caerostris extrusa TaxID=172846 RepID=A0AAV4WTJ2_CAEEX|nr:hypothetical protein CEXT_644851 [Caerostris extrusa]